MLILKIFHFAFTSLSIYDYFYYTILYITRAMYNIIDIIHYLYIGQADATEMRHWLQGMSPLAQCKKKILTFNI